MKEKKNCSNCKYLTKEIKCTNTEYLNARANYKSTGKSRNYCKWHELSSK